LIFLSSVSDDIDTSSTSSSLSPKSLSPPKSSSRVYRFLHCIIL
ncbi:unnamed protein product, partial [Rotaria sp. Silwood1]